MRKTVSSYNLILKIFTNQFKNILNEKINFEKQFINISNNDRNN